MHLDIQQIGEIRKLDYTLQFTNDIQNIDGRDNKVADAMFRMELHHVSTTIIDLQVVAGNQEAESELAYIKFSILLCASRNYPSSYDSKIHCDFSADKA